MIRTGVEEITIANVSSIALGGVTNEHESQFSPRQVAAGTCKVGILSLQVILMFPLAA